MKEARGFAGYHCLVGNSARGAQSGWKYDGFYQRLAMVAAGASRLSAFSRQFAFAARTEEGRNDAGSHPRL
jgi:hypothetical protein